MPTKSASSITYLLMLMCSGLVLFVISELANLRSPHAELTRHSSKDASKRQVLEKIESFEYSPPPASNFTVISKRPLFWPSRAPSVAFSAAEAPVPIEPLDLTLVGVIITSERRWALLRRGAAEEADQEWRPANSTMSAHQGQEFHGWLVEVIEKDRIILRKADVVEVLNLSAGLRGRVHIAPHPASEFYDIDMFLPET